MNQGVGRDQVKLHLVVVVAAAVAVAVDAEFSAGSHADAKYDRRVVPNARIVGARSRVTCPPSCQEAPSCETRFCLLRADHGADQMASPGRLFRGHEISALDNAEFA